MRTIIAGSREGVSYKDIEDAIAKCPWTPTVVLCGMARGADTYGFDWATKNNIAIEYFPANWEKYGRKAGPIRNQEMADNAEALIAVWNGYSTGTNDMIKRAKYRNLKVFIHCTL